MKKYKIIALIGKAGSGKDRIMNEVLAAAPDRFNQIISCTTRPMREGEVEGVNYYYLTEKEFRAKMFNDEMLETTFFNNWFYGTMYSALSADKPNIGVFDPAGIVSMLERDDIDLTVYMVVCDDKTRLLRQLNREQDPDVNEIVRRFQTDDEDFKNLEFNTFILENNLEEHLPFAVAAVLYPFETTCGQGQNKLMNQS